MVVGYRMFVGTFGVLLGPPQWAMDMSPFGMLPVPPGESFAPLPTFAMVAVAAGLFALGVWGQSAATSPRRAEPPTLASGP